MILGVDLHGAELERYKAVRRARELMESEGVPSPYVVNPYCAPTPRNLRRPRNIWGRAPSIAPSLAAWLEGRDVFKLVDAARALGCSAATVHKAYKFLKSNNLTDARLLGSGNVKCNLDIINRKRSTPYCNR